MSKSQDKDKTWHIITGPLATFQPKILTVVISEVGAATFATACQCRDVAKVHAFSCEGTII